MKAPVLLVLMYMLGYLVAHHEVANECDKIGIFYVGNRVFECHQIESKQ